jgi:adenylate cyclase
VDTLVSTTPIEFGGFRFDRRTDQLLRRDDSGGLVAVPLGSRARVLLRVLVERAGELVSKQEIMDAVWPDTAVEDNNLTVQLSTLRRVLDAGRAEGSCIQTVQGRGYRFVERVTVPVEPVIVSPRSEVVESPLQPAMLLPAPLRPAAPRRRWLWAVAVCAVLAAAFLAAPRLRGWWSAQAAPRLSVVVLPFANLGSGPGDDGLADGIAADLTSDLTRDLQATVTAPASANAYKGHATDPRQAAAALGDRYVVSGSVRRTEATLRVDVQLMEAETGTVLWSDRFDEANADGLEERVVARLRGGVIANLVATESARSLRERPDHPDAFDLVLRGRAIELRGVSLERENEALALYERALVIDPSYVPALERSAFIIIDTKAAEQWGTFATLRRAQTRLARARELAPDQADVLATYLYFLRNVGRCPEVIDLARRAIQTGPDRVRSSDLLYSTLGWCLVRAGHAEKQITLQQAAIESVPLSTETYNRYRHIGTASLLLAHDQDAVTYLRRSIDLHSDVDADTPWKFRLLAAAYARNGQIDSAHQALVEADRLFPFHTVRDVSPDYSPNPVYREHLRRLQDTLRVAGERDHADEGADTGVPSDDVLHGVLAGHTPLTAPGATTITSADLPRLLADTKPLVVDTMMYSWNQSIPGAVGLMFAGLGGDFSDEAQGRLRPKMGVLTGGDFGRPIVVVGWNAERFDGRNLALRLVALGYTHVYWYRGGREAWEVAGLPEAAVDVQNW